MRKYHLCLVNSQRTWGGAEVWFLDTAVALLESGHQVSIVAQPDSELLEQARRAGVPTAAIAIRFDAAPWTLARLAQYFRSQKVTAIVANLTKDLKAAAVAGRLAGVGTILATRESDFPLKDKLYYRWYFNTLASGVLVNSLATEQTIRASVPWLPQDRVHLLYKGIDCRRFLPADQPPIKPVVGFVGQLIERKGLLDLMAAWRLVEAHDRPDCPVLRLAGQGPMADQLQHWRQKLKHPEQVQIQGFVEDTPGFYKDLNLLVIPSHSEGFGLAAAEAAACGLPVIATRASSLPEIVVHNQTGLLVPPRNPTQLAAALITLLDDPYLRVKYGQAGRRHIRQNFDCIQTIDCFLELTGAWGRTSS